MILFLHILSTSFIGNENAADANKETSTFKRALPQFLAVGVKNMLLLGKPSPLNGQTAAPSLISFDLHGQATA